MNYKKWDNIVDSDDEGASKDENAAIITTCQHMKLRADEFFARAEGTSDPYHYQLACMEYETILPRLIEVLSVDPSLKSKLSTVITSCKMNIACALLKLKKNHDAIKRCDDVLIDSSIAELTVEQVLRARYFRGFAMLSIGTSNTLSYAREDAAEMKKLLEIHSKSLPESQISDYSQLFQMLSDPHLIPLEETPENSLARDTKVNSKAISKPKGATTMAAEKPQVDMNGAWKLLHEGRNIDAANAFRGLLNSSSIATMSRADISTTFLGIAQSCAALGDGDKVTLAAT